MQFRSDSLNRTPCRRVAVNRGFGIHGAGKTIPWHAPCFYPPN